jgi:hypothetical protein
MPTGSLQEYITALSATGLANWSDDPQHGFHYNRNYHDAEWLDFQWAQTGHGGEHLPYKVFDMYDNLPVKASANGEPTYEQMGRPDNATGWWQGHEAWINITYRGDDGTCIRGRRPLELEACCR